MTWEKWAIVVLGLAAWAAIGAAALLTIGDLVT